MSILNVLMGVVCSVASSVTSSQLGQTRWYPQSKSTPADGPTPADQWNCSVPYTICNNISECAGGQDERDCTCRHGGLRFHDDCYFLVYSRTDTSTWLKAQQACRREQASLAILPTVEHFTVVDFLKRNFSTRPANVFIGMVTEEHPFIFPSQMFTCHVGRKRIPFSLVCDYRQDCHDNSDENFCVHTPCSLSSRFQCANKQCIPFKSKCDYIADCVDNSDEENCWHKWSTSRKLPPVIVNFTKDDMMVQSHLDISASCPDTHFYCSNHDYCLPVYVMCNGVKDCPGHEDEADCDTYTCPGLYRCRLSKICLHPDHVCDGWPHCPQHDDERYCDLTCPDGCDCLGHEFKCNAVFTPGSYPQMRYLDVNGSMLSPKSLEKNTLLLYLRLSTCNLTTWTNIHLPNLLTLDVRSNKIRMISSDDFIGLGNLRFLVLARNPITDLFGTPHINSSLARSLRHFDVSGIAIRELDVRRLVSFPNLLTLNLTDSAVEQVLGDGFQSLTHITVLDLRGCPTVSFPRDVFRNLRELKQLYADNYKLCCPSVLPDGFNMDNCLASVNEMSSCDDLLRSDIYRVGLSVLAFFTLIGNCGSLVLRVKSLRTRAVSGFNVFVTHLCVSDFLMGVYLTMVGVADRWYMGQYLWEDVNWRQSAACHVAGFLSLLSSEMSACIICLITIDRFVAIRFPFSQVRFTRNSANVTSLITWLGCIALASVPLLPFTSSWEFYGQTGICIPLPITRNTFPGYDFAFGIMIILNLFLFIIIALGQVSIYISMSNNAMTLQDKSRQSRDLTVARRLFSVVVSDFCCWFPVALLGVMSSRGILIPGEINVAAAIFVLPLNSALNPFLYTLNVIQEKRHRAKEKRLIAKLLEGQNKTKQKEVITHNS